MTVFVFSRLAVLLSFAFYLPWVLLSHEVSIAGMLILPKTVMYIWMIVMFRKAALWMVGMPSTPMTNVACRGCMRGRSLPRLKLFFPRL